MGRIEREKQTVRNMIMIYCKSHHNISGNELCAKCEALCNYAHNKLGKCPFGDDKSSCRKCKIHCYEPKYKEEISKVMRYVGPRMIFIEPLATIRHLFSELKTR